MPVIKTVYVHLLVGCLGLGIAHVSTHASRAETFEERVSVIEVEIPVQVTRDGEPVSGLTADDFEVYDQGEQREIVAFEIVDLSTSSVVTGTERVRQTDAAEPEPVQRHLLLLFDFLFTPPHELERGVRGAKKMVANQLHPADRMIVAYYGINEGVVILTGFTRDQRELELALDVVDARVSRKSAKYQRAMQALGAHQGETSGVERLVKSFGWPVGLALSGSALPTIDVSLGENDSIGVNASKGARYDDGSVSNEVLSRILINDPAQMAQDSAQQAAIGVVKDFSESLGELATLLRDVRGPRHMLIFSEGFPEHWFNPMEPILTVILRELKVMHQAFVRGGWILHSVDLAGIPGAQGGQSIQAWGAPPVLQSTMDVAVLFGSGGPTNPNDALFYLANETGGDLFQNYNYFEKATKRVLTKTSRTYVLHVNSGEIANDGRFHRLKVKLRDDPAATRLSHRTGYYAPRPEITEDPLERRLDAAARLFGEEEIHELRAVAQVMPHGAGNRPAQVPVLIQFDGESLLTGQVGDVLPLDIQGYALNNAGGVIDYFIQELRLDLAKVKDALTESGLQFYADLELGAGEYRLRLMVQNRSTRRSFLTTVPVTVNGPSTSPALLQPFLLNLRTASVFAKEASAEVTRLFTMQDRVILPSLEPSLSAGEAWPIYVAGSNLSGNDGKFSILLKSADGSQVDGGGHVRLDQRLPKDSLPEDSLPEDAGSVERFLGQLDTTGLEPGSYRVELVFESATGASLSSSLFHVKG